MHGIHDVYICMRNYYHSSGMLSSTGRHAVDADAEVSARAMSASILLSSLMAWAAEALELVACCDLLNSAITCSAVLSPCVVRDMRRAASALVRMTLTLTTRRLWPFLPGPLLLLVLGVAWSSGADVSLLAAALATLLLQWGRFVVRWRVPERNFMERDHCLVFMRGMILLLAWTKHGSMFPICACIMCVCVRGRVSERSVSYVCVARLSSREIYNAANQEYKGLHPAK